MQTTAVPDAATIIGLDVGGANLKAATADGRTRSVPFELWRRPADLADQLRELLRGWPIEALALTMTGELADCYATKGDGVRDIVAAACAAAGRAPVRVWSTAGEFLSPEDACARPLDVAAANWHAQAAWVGRWLPEPLSLLIDIGSTTTDVIPIASGRPATRGRTDATRLIAGELVYTGARRTPVCAVVRSLPWRGRACPVAAEWFATMLDVHLLLGAIPEDAADLATADGRPATRAAAWNRLAHQICCDTTELTFDEARVAAEAVAEAQQQQLAAAVTDVVADRPAPCGAVLISGSGRFIARRLAARHPALRSARLLDLGEVSAPEIADAACAYAVAVLAAMKRQETDRPDENA